MRLGRAGLGGRLLLEIRTGMRYVGGRGSRVRHIVVLLG